MRETSHSPEAIAVHRRRVPHDPVVHCHGELGVSSRWWYLPGMYKPIVAKCHCCDGAEEDGKTLIRNMAASKQVAKTSDLYKIPVVTRWKDYAKVCATWPRFDVQSKVFDVNNSGISFLELSEHEQKALVVVNLVVTAPQEKKQPCHWKKTQLSRAYFKGDLVHRDAMPSEKCKAAFDFLMKNNEFYRLRVEEQHKRIAAGSSLNISSLDLFINIHGIECAMFPVLYPFGSWSDTGLKQAYVADTSEILPLVGGTKAGISCQILVAGLTLKYVGGPLS